MSGGYFNYNQYKIEDIASEIDSWIASNPFERPCAQYPPAIIEKFKETAHTLRQASEMLQRVDRLASDDDSEESFLSRWEEEVRPYWAKPQK